MSTERTRKSDWGFSCLVEGAEKTILFDTGTKPEVLMHNTEVLGVDLNKVDLIVLSHGHGDHTGGLPAVLEKNPKVEVMFPVSFGADFAAMITKAGAAPRAINKPVEICRNVFLTGEMGGPIKEMALVLETSRGLVVVTGCSHPGIVDILKRAREIRERPIHLVFGGFHLMNAPEASIKLILDAFEGLGVERCGATHCTGDRQIAMIKARFGDRYVPMGTGRVIEVPGPGGGVMSDDERGLRRYAPVLKTAGGFALVGLMFAAAGAFLWPAFWVLSGILFPDHGRLDALAAPPRSRAAQGADDGGSASDAKGWDRAILRAYAALFAVMLLIAPLDAVRFRWSHVPRAVQGLALIGLFAAWCLIVWVSRENAFLSEVVRIQTDRGHTVCTTGPYRTVRHPMYVAIIVTILCVPVLLGSLYALIPAALIAALFVLRTGLEDKTLQAELPGYAEYARSVRWRLVPGIW